LTIYKGHYETFDVMKEKEHWDEHTKKIINHRLTEKPLHFFTEKEAKMMYQLCSILLDDRRQSIMKFVIEHIDATLNTNIGDSQRKAKVPKQTVLIREGLALLDRSCLLQHERTFSSVTDKIRKDIIENIMKGVFPTPAIKQTVPIMEFIYKILQEATAAYYSHPTVWSEIGYAGPAYPRGYVRTEIGLTDPWEARRDAK